MPDVHLEGGCLCGNIRYKLVGAPIDAALCHCGMCRRASAAPAVAWTLVHSSQLQFIGGGTLRTYESSPGCARGFCPECGSQISFTAHYMPGLVDITIGSLDDPSRVTPSAHYWHSRRVPWLNLADAWVRHAGAPQA